MKSLERGDDDILLKRVEKLLTDNIDTVSNLKCNFDLIESSLSPQFSKPKIFDHPSDTDDTEFEVIQSIKGNNALEILHQSITLKINT